MSSFKEHLICLGVLEEFIYVARREPDYLEHKWANRTTADGVYVHNILYYEKAAKISEVNWGEVFTSFKQSAVSLHELLEIMEGTEKKPSIFRNNL
jgi:hypothetical protein